MSKLSKQPDALTGYQFDEVKPTSSELLWEAHEVLACLATILQYGNDSDVGIEFDDSARRGLGRILRHCSQIAIDAVGLESVERKEAERAPNSPQ